MVPAGQGVEGRCQVSTLVQSIAAAMYADNQLEKPSVNYTNPEDMTSLVDYEESSEDIFGDIRWEMDMNVLKTHYVKGHFEK